MNAWASLYAAPGTTWRVTYRRVSGWPLFRETPLTNLEDLLGGVPTIGRDTGFPRQEIASTVANGAFALVSGEASLRMVSGDVFTAEVVSVSGTMLGALPESVLTVDPDREFTVAGVQDIGNVLSSGEIEDASRKSAEDINKEGNPLNTAAGKVGDIGKRTAGLIPLAVAAGIVLVILLLYSDLRKVV